MDPSKEAVIDSSDTNPSIGATSTASPQRTPSQSSLGKSAGAGHVAPHRQSFADNLRNAPSSPRSQRHPSFTQAAVQELLAHPPGPGKHANPRFAGRDWRDVSVGELVSQEDVKWVDMDTSVEDATMLLVRHSPINAVLVREDASSKTAISTFDYSDLNAYLLVVVGLAKPDDEHMILYKEIATKAQQQASIPLREIQPICRKETLVTLPAEEKLAKAIEVFGSGIHRVLVTNESSEVVGVLSQLRLIEFFWNEAVNFPSIEKLYPAILRDLGIGTHQIFSVNSDSPLADALSLMNDEGLTSVAVTDNGHNVVGNISTADVRHLTSTTNAPLLKSSCMHFISVILSERGVEKGRDAFPVFYVNPYSTLAHTVAKLVATQSHRMWVVESASPSPSAPATPLLAPTVVPPGTSSAPQSPLPLPNPVVASVPAAAMPGAGLSGRLTGVVSLTDVLNMFARSTGLHPSDPGEQRARRRRSSSSSVRPSMDSARASFDIRR